MELLAQRRTATGQDRQLLLDVLDVVLDVYADSDGSGPEDDSDGEPVEDGALEGEGVGDGQGETASAG